jgi:hypothetical protein
MVRAPALLARKTARDDVVRAQNRALRRVESRAS